MAASLPTFKSVETCMSYKVIAHIESLAGLVSFALGGYDKAHTKIVATWNLNWC